MPRPPKTNPLVDPIVFCSDPCRWWHCTCDKSVRACLANADVLGAVLLVGDGVALLPLAPTRSKKGRLTLPLPGINTSVEQRWMALAQVLCHDNLKVCFNGQCRTPPSPPTPSVAL
jgi:hypothetical protein